MDRTESTEVLAPGAGVGIGKRMAAILIAQERFCQKLADTFSGALDAESWGWDDVAKKKILVPDWRTRLDAAKAILAHMEGEPIRRIMVEHHGDEGVNPTAELDRAIENNPHLIRAMEKQLARAKRRLSEKLVDLPE